MIPDTLPPRDPPERPLLRPWISPGPEPALRYVDPRGRAVALALSPLDLAHLHLSLAEALVALARTGSPPP